ncbi:YdaU family protein [Spongiibacter marinus]|uniref:YdaU family protein n=1 Tax=Spongiibacter marinus TaxID=354246 RepID=UPI0035BE7133
MHYFQLNMKTFNSSTIHLTRLERSIYFDLLFEYYTREEPITSDISTLARRVRVSTDEEKEALKFVLEEFFTFDGNVYRIQKCDDDIAAYQSNAEARSRAGKASARKRAKKSEENSLSATKPGVNGTDQPTSVQHTTNACSTHAEHMNNARSTNQEPETSNNKPVTIRSAKRGKNAQTRKSKTLINPEATISDKQIARAKDYWQEYGEHHLNPETEWQKFLAYHAANGLEMADWDSAWTMWYTRAPEFKQVNSHSLPHSSSPNKTLGFIHSHTDRSWAEGL